jgi:hypothetical protein
LTLLWLGWIPDDLTGCPPIALDRLAQALGIASDASSALLEIAAHLTPAQHDHNFYGTYSFDIDAELSREGHRSITKPTPSE